MNHNLGKISPLFVIMSCAFVTCLLISNIIAGKLITITNGRWLWSRTIGSTVVGEGIDTMVFITIAFIGLMPHKVLIQMALIQYIWKVGYEVLITPITYLAVNWLKRKEGIDIFDYGIRYNPFKFDI